MKLSRARIRNGVMMAALVFFFGGIGAITSRAQEVERIAPSESPKAETPSAPAESPRSDPAPAPSSPSSSSPSSGSNNDNSSSNSSRGSDSGNSGSSSNDSGSSSRSRGDGGGKAPKVDSNGNVRRSSERSNSRERVLVDKMPVTTSGSSGSDSGRGRDRDRDRDRDRGRDGWRGRRGHDRDRHRHRQDDCYLVPAYDDTVVYQPTTYPTKPADSRTAYERGYDDGVFTGAHDGRRQQTYEPQRSHFYKDPPGYRAVLGSRDVYKQAYRDGFLRGYREGFQNWQKYFVGGEFRR